MHRVKTSLSGNTAFTLVKNHFMLSAMKTNDGLGPHSADAAILTFVEMLCKRAFPETAKC